MQSEHPIRDRFVRYSPPQWYPTFLSPSQYATTYTRAYQSPNSLGTLAEPNPHFARHSTYPILYQHLKETFEPHAHGHHFRVSYEVRSHYLSVMRKLNGIVYAHC